MRTNALYRTVFNRKKEDLAPDDKALLQIEIRFTNGSRMLVSTGIYLADHQFDARTGTITGTGIDAKLNKQVQDFIGRLRTAEIDADGQGFRFDKGAVIHALRPKNESGSFLRFARGHLARKKVTFASGTVALHTLVLDQLEALGIVAFSDLTVSNIYRYDEMLKADGLTQTTVYKRHRTVMTYINLAIAEDLLPFERDPYNRVKIPRGKHRIRTRLDDSELTTLREAKIDDPDLALVRDCYLLQCYTTISYKDLCALRPDQLRRDDEFLWVEGLRKKTGEYYAVPLLPEAEAIIDRYAGVDPEGRCLPAPPIYTQNRRLKVLAASLGVSKNLTTHTGRHTGATWMLRRGVSKEQVQAMLGHASMRTTEIYAVLERQMLKDAVKKLRGR